MLTDDDVNPTPPVEEPPSVLGASLRTAVEWLAILVVAVVVALVFRAFFIQSFWIKSGSMEHTLEIRDRVMVSRLSYRIGEPQHGQIVVFRRVDGAATADKDLIKRVIAIGGETVEGRDGVVLVNGEAIDEPYLPPGAFTSDFGPETVPPDHFWAMGDNRTRSSDSRFFGPVPYDNLIGRAFFRYWPPGRIGSP